MTRLKRCRLNVMHVYEPRLSAEQRRAEAATFRRALKALGRTRPEIIEVESGAPGSAIREEAGRHRMVVLGAYAEASRSSVVWTAA